MIALCFFFVCITHTTYPEDLTTSQQGGLVPGKRALRQNTAVDLHTSDGAGMDAVAFGLQQCLPTKPPWQLIMNIKDPLARFTHYALIHT